ncbi:MAG: M16 family metallopeptidase, partial [Myxococcales bacterium]
WALIEASRLAAPVPRDFYAEREVVMEERRMRVESEPLGALFEELFTVAFSASPYRWPTVGYFSDLHALTVEDAMRFHEEHYAPANAVGALVGDIDLEATKKLLDRTFGAIPARPLPRSAPPREPPQTSQRRSTVFFNAEPQLAMAFHKPTLPSREDYVFDVIQLVLTEGRTSRLWRSVVQQKQLAAQLFGTMGPGARLDHLFIIGATPMAGRRFEEVEEAIWAELERLKREGISLRELQMVQNKLSAHHAREISTNAGLASSLTYFETLAGDWRYMADHRKNIASITPKDVQEVAQRYFVPENSTIVRLQRKPGAADAKKEAAR